MKVKTTEAEIQPLHDSSLTPLFIKYIQNFEDRVDKNKIPIKLQNLRVVKNSKGDEQTLRGIWLVM